MQHKIDNLREIIDNLVAARAKEEPEEDLEENENEDDDGPIGGDIVYRIYFAMTFIRMSLCCLWPLVRIHQLG